VIPVEVRKFTQKGIDRFKEDLEKLALQDLEPRRDLLFDPSCTQVLKPERKIEYKKFRTHLELAAYLDSVLKDLHITRLEREQGL